MTDIYEPQKAFQYRRLSTIKQAIAEHGPKFDYKVREGHSEEDAFKVVFCRMFQGVEQQIRWYRLTNKRYEYLRITEDAIVLTEMAMRSLFYTKLVIKGDVYQKFSEHQVPFDLHDNVKFTDVFTLLRTAATDFKTVSRKNKLKRREVHDARMVCAQLFQIMLLELAESVGLVEKAMSSLTNYLAQWVFDPRALEDIHFRYLIDPENHGRVRGTCTDDGCSDKPKVRVAKNRKKLKRVKMRPKRNVREPVFPWSCRAINLKGKRFWCYVSARGKEANSYLNKRMRKRDVTDRLGVRVTVVAVEDHGQLRVANRGDVELVAQFILARVFVPDSTPFETTWTWDMPRENDKNRNSAQHFHHRQIKGFFNFEIGGRLVKFRCEFSIMALADRLNGDMPGTPENHQSRARELAVHTMIQRYPRAKGKL